MAERSEDKRRKRIKRRTKRVAAFAFTAILAASALLVFLYRDRLADVSLGEFIRRDTEIQISDAFTYETGTEQVFARVGKGLAVMATNGFTLLDSAGNTVAKQLLSINQPAIAPSENKCAFYDVGGKVLRIADMDGNIIVMDTESAIISVTMNASGYMAVVTEESGYKGKATAYGSDLEPIYEWSSGSGYVLKAEVSPDNREMAVLCATAEGGRTAIFSFGNKLEKASYSAPDEFLLDLHYLDNKKLFVISESRAVFLDPAGEPQWSYDFGEMYLTDYEFGGDGFVSVLLSRYRSGNAISILTLDGDSVIGELQTQRDMLSMSAYGKQLLVLFSDALTLYSSDLEEQGEYTEIHGVRRAVLRAKNDALLLSAYSAENVKLDSKGLNSSGSEVEDG